MRGLLGLLLAGGVRRADGGCTCQWTLAEPAGMHWSGGSDNQVVPSETVVDCQDACCHASGADCDAWTYNGNEGVDERCTLWTGIPTAVVWSPGWTSGKLATGSADCSEDEIDGIPISWLFVLLLLGGSGTYFVGGIVLKRGRGGGSDWLPHHGFWTRLGGLVVDGLAFVLRRGSGPPAAPAAAERSSIQHPGGTQPPHPSCSPLPQLLRVLAAAHCRDHAAEAVRL